MVHRRLCRFLRHGVRTHDDFLLVLRYTVTTLHLVIPASHWFARTHDTPQVCPDVLHIPLHTSEFGAHHYSRRVPEGACCESLCPTSGTVFSLLQPLLAPDCKPLANHLGPPDQLTLLSIVTSMHTEYPGLVPRNDAQRLHLHNDQFCRHQHQVQSLGGPFDTHTVFGHMSGPSPFVCMRSIAGSLLYSYRQYQVTQERMKKGASGSATCRV